MIFAIACLGLAVLVVGESSAAPSASLGCMIGPANKTYGGTKWLVYSCADNRTVVIVSAPNSPAAPFYFEYYPTKDGYHLYGEGDGNKRATDAAEHDLSKLSETDISALIAETKRR